MTGVLTYITYAFKDKDPVIDEMRTIVKDSGKSYAQISAESGVSPTTPRNWFYGNTRRPQFATVKAMAIALDHDLVLVPVTGRSRQPKLRKRKRNGK